MTKEIKHACHAEKRSICRRSLQSLQMLRSAQDDKEGLKRNKKFVMLRNEASAGLQ
jgi:hypothetical protein